MKIANPTNVNELGLLKADADQRRAASKAAAAPTPAAGAAPQRSTDTVELASTLTRNKPAEQPSDAALTAQSPRVDVAAEPSVEALTPQPDTAAPAARQTFTQQDIDNLLAIYGSSAGQENFDATYDLNSDGVIDFQDLSEALRRVQAEPPSPPVYTLTDLNGLLGAYGATTGQDGYNEAWDLNGDGVIDFSDLSSMLANFSATVAENAATMLDGLLGAYGSQKGDDNYNEKFDLTGTGRVDFGDLSALLRELFHSS